MSRRVNQLRDYNNDDEAEEDFGNHSNFDEDNQELNEGENLDDNPERDYNPDEKLDNYDQNELDDQQYSEMSIGERRKADLEVERREKLLKKNLKHGKEMRNIPAALKNESEISVMSEGINMSQEMKKRREAYYEEIVEDDFDEEDVELNEKYLDLEHCRGKLAEWMSDPKTIRWIKKSFRTFLTRYQNENGKFVYIERINEMCSNNKSSLDITYKNLTETFPTIAYWVFESPAILIPSLNQVTFDLICKMFPGFHSIKSEIFVKICEFPLEEKIRELRTSHINTLIKIRGVVTRRYATYSQLKKLYYICRCGDRKGPIYETEFSQLKLGQCVYCHSSGPYIIDSESAIYKSNQKITVQESPSTVPPGRVPRSKEVILLGDNIDIARPGDEIEIVGIYSTKFDFGMNVKHGFPVFSTFIEANSVKRVRELEMTEITPEDKEAILKLAQNPNVFDIITNAIAPSIYGHRSIKTSLALALFGGTSIDTETHKVRGDINILLVGDPGLSKSQFLKYVQTISSRSVYTTGKGASAVGLTACVRKDPVSGDWSLEGGALVLADNGICLIDEFDKMNEVDRTSIHEAMEQQTISISKAGIVATLQAKCSIIAAANPIKGLYDNQLGFQDNLNLSEPILSRFDVICVLKDELDFAHDKALAHFIIKSHQRSHPELIKQAKAKPENTSERQNEPRNNSIGEDKSIPFISQKLLKKYIIYAKNTFRPKLTQGCSHKLTNFYTKLRTVSHSVSGINVVVRHLESMIRFAEASAKIHLRNETNDKDVDIAISMLLDSFLQSTKPSIAKNLERKFALEINVKRNVNSLLGYILNNLVKKQIEYLDVLQVKNTDDQITEIKIPLSVLEEKAKEHQIYSVDQFLRSEQFRSNYLLKGEMIIKEI